jgi:hypothetical protein
MSTHHTSGTLTAAQTARLLHKLGFNWLDVEFVLDLAPSEKRDGHSRYRTEQLQKFVNRAFWMNEQPVEFTPLKSSA